MNRKTTVKREASIVIQIDEQHPDFNQWLEYYKEMIDPEATLDNISEHLAYNVLDSHADNFFEGFGYVQNNGQFGYYARQNPDSQLPFINVIDNDGEVVEFEHEEQ